MSRGNHSPKPTIMRTFYFICMLTFMLLTLWSGAFIDTPGIILLFILFACVTCLFFLLWRDSEHNKYFTAKIAGITFVGRIKDKRDYYAHVREFRTKKEAERFADQQNRKL